MWKIPIFDVTFNKAERSAVERVIRSRWLTMGDVTKSFEKKFSKFIGVKHAIAVSNGTSALHLANLALGLKREDEVICPGLTFVAGPNSVMYTGATGVFADISGLEDLNISPDSIEAKITGRTKAVQVLHYGGYPCDMDSIMRIASRYGLSVIEDCAHAPGAEYRGRKCGSIGDIGCFSFFSNKNMTTGEGGMVTTDNDALAEKIRLMRSHGMTTLTLDRHRGHSFSYNIVEKGLNYRIDEIRSAIGRAQLKKLKSNNKKRNDLTSLYRERLSSVSWLKIPFIKNREASSCHIFPVLLDEGLSRLKFMTFMKKCGVQTGIHYPAIHLFDFYRREFGYKEGLLPFTEKVCQREVSLPLHPSMRKKDVHYISDAITKYFNKTKGLS